ncbi:PREDICTED: transmembrane protein 42 [Habropoda laboriosa]|uniref:transmembrane protein 42 n=1 Tax=Habropoda laboriosa TaxID=597456 RepID=UPI00083CF015|nr:PREDICTED: transmembrane protein 42 [Habropoda laboriosa]
MKRELLTDSSSLSSRESECFSATCIKDKKQEGKVRLAVISGFFATGGSLFGKLAGNIELDSIVGMLFKGILLILMVTSNTVGCTFFVKALNASGSSLPCTIASAATSYVCSALAGFLVFNESTSMYWWCGISFVILGLLLICHVPSKKDAAPSVKKSKEE